MNELDYINHKITSLFETHRKEKSNISLQTFHNSYRYDPELDIKKIGGWKPDWYSGTAQDLINLNSGKHIGTMVCVSCGADLSKKKCKETCKFSTPIQHSWEPIETNLDSELWDCLRNTILTAGRDIPVLHSEQSSELNKLTTMGFKPVHWFANGVLCADHWYRLYKDIPIVTEYQPLEHKFICANRLIDNKRSYRIKFLNMLDVNQGTYSLLKHDPHTNRTPNEIYPDNKVLPHSFDEHNNSSAWLTLRYWNESSRQFDSSIWKSSFLHVVSETVVDRVHLTEKMFKPIVLKQPFVLLNGAGGLEYLRSYGFKTFNDFWSEDYDEIENLDQRLQAVADIVNDIGSCSLSQLEKIRDRLKPILEHNYNWFYNGFADKCWAELETNISVHTLEA
jgi:hypothetical protein